MLDPVLPLALYLLLGYLFKRFIYDSSKQLVDYVIFFALPSLVFSKIYPLSLDLSVLGLIVMFIGFILISLMLSYLIGRMLQLDKVTLATFIILATFGNTSFIGFPYIDAFYGQDYIVYGLIYDFFGSFLMLVSLGMVIITWGGGGKSNLKSILKNVVLFPPMVAFFITVVLRNIEIPNFFLLTTQSLGSTLVPIAMIAIGMKLELHHLLVKLPMVSVVLMLKMFIFPALVFLGFHFFYNTDETWVKVTVIEMAMPPMTMATVLAIKGGLDEKLAINALVIGVLISLLSIALFSGYMG